MSKIAKQKFKIGDVVQRNDCLDRYGIISGITIDIYTKECTYHYESLDDDGNRTKGSFSCEEDVNKVELAEKGMRQKFIKTWNKNITDKIKELEKRKIS